MPLDAHPEGEPCPVCGAPTRLLDVVDFNKSCIEAQGQFLELSGLPIYYVVCPTCAFAFAPTMWKWDPEAFRDHVYNDAYEVVDPDYLGVRPDNNAQAVIGLFPELGAARHLDYGGGNGRLSRTLREAGIDSRSFDPFVEGHDQRPQETFDLVTAFEVFEHVPSIERLMLDLSALTHDESLVMFSTAISDGNIAENQRLSWWYAAPRNGHISLYSRNSLARLANHYGFYFGSFNDGLHLFWRKTVPAWARDLIRLG